ncbi:hypothetical protein ACPWT1_01350 [Ramlibacter sp. MMS24-I3-19]|uniref:hypothetical protein n=1 Tax=Ramlibacter sp. MMS24-I3-19 TaxID=3416606 RepID=UPI003CFE268A
MRSLVLLAAVGASLAGCAATATQPTLQPAVHPSPHESLVEAARSDAAGRSGLPAREMKLVALESVTWPDGSLGCPRPGMGYTQALVPGYRIRLQVGREVWDYHASERGGLVLCPPGRAQEPVPGGGRS